MKKLATIICILISLNVWAQQTNSSGLTITAQQSVDGKQYKTLNGRHMPYASTIEFLAYVVATRRHVGEIAYISNGALIETWQFVGGISDINFVKTSSGNGLQSVTNIDSTTTKKITARTFRATSLPTYINNLAAIAGGLQDGDMYKLPYNNGSYLSAFVVISSLMNAFLNENGTALLNENNQTLIIE